MSILYDMHCHLGFCPSAEGAATALAAAEIAALSCSVTPQDYSACAQALAGWENVRVAAGFHPWWVGQAGAGTLDKAVAQVQEQRYVGEIGLDFGSAHALSAEAQQKAFRALLDACKQQGNKLISLHAVQSATQVLDQLEQAGIFATDAGNACIFHWFSGTSDELVRARKLGCYFSINPKMVEGKRGAAYIQQIPANQVLLETDKPIAEGVQIDANAMRSLLESTLNAVAQAQGGETEAVVQQIAATSSMLLQM